MERSRPLRARPPQKGREAHLREQAPRLQSQGPPRRERVPKVLSRRRDGARGEGVEGDNEATEGD